MTVWPAIVYVLAGGDFECCVTIGEVTRQQIRNATPYSGLFSFSISHSLPSKSFPCFPRRLPLSNTCTIVVRLELLSYHLVFKLENVHNIISECITCMVNIGKCMHDYYKHFSTQYATFNPGGFSPSKGATGGFNPRPLVPPPVFRKSRPKSQVQVLPRHPPLPQPPEPYLTYDDIYEER